MSVVRYRCPSTDEEVTTAIETGNDVLFKMRSMDLKIWVWCPHCMAGHTIAPKDAILDDDTVLSDAPLAASDLPEPELSPPEPLTLDGYAERSLP
jgi:hypothetical protein